jgi:hypothetical protein
MLVYSVASVQSFEMVQVIRDKILNHLVRGLPVSDAALFQPTDFYRARNGFLLSSWATRVTCDLSSVM